MAPGGDSAEAGQALAKQTVFLFGRAQGLTRRRLDQLVRLRGGKLSSKPSTRVTVIAVGHSATSHVLADGRVRLPVGLPASAILISEKELRRRLGLLGPPPDVDRSLASAEIERLAGLTPTLVACLALFDVLEPVEARFAYRDVVAAREVGRLLTRGIDLGQILGASVTLGRRGSHLAEARLTEGPSGELVRELGGQLAELSGQLTMRLEQDVRGIDELVAAAELAEEDNDLATAESLYTTAMRADAGDPVLPFNLGNVFDAQGRAAEAKIAWQIAVARDPAFAEAWYNLAMAAEDEAHEDLAIAEYRRAVQAQPEFADAHYNLALLLTKLDRCEEALAAWERFLELAPKSGQASTARRAAALCRMRIRQKQAQTG
ncbi:tetratricopeptide repeat protein [Reyranella sp. CPCC 100927]|uniref:tetratricopeptide repeat protein n=1 Tax=Reyranella sp. CPCC 100927 TaxID=2599616 RepID=UPI0011B38D6E|nr:tetratricopeptide repeat protein [Reyranella sp. CPCC 100927]TWT11471.1 tetratricopeptide repeat protein [Reyranella sp. CPCC 100927]